MQKRRRDRFCDGPGEDSIAAESCERLKTAGAAGGEESGGGREKQQADCRCGHRQRIEGAHAIEES